MTKRTLQEQISELRLDRDELIAALRPFAQFACDSRPERCGCNNCRAATLIARLAQKVPSEVKSRRKGRG